MDIVKKCKDVWYTSVSETEQFTAIQVIIKLLKSSGLSYAQKKEIFDTIGFPFLTRLLQIEKVPRGCSLTVRKSVALSVLANFSTDPEVATSDQLCSMTAEFKNILNTGLSTPSGGTLVSDALECICNMARHYKSRKHLFENGITYCLVKLYITDACDKSMLLQILKVMLFYFRGGNEEKESTAFEFCLLKMIKDLPRECSGGDICTRRSALAILCDPLGKVLGNEEWVLDLQGVLTEILRSKENKEQRNLALKLASLVVDKCGTIWLGDDRESSKIFFLVLVSEVCDEVCYLIKDRTVEDIFKDTFVLSACFTILESIIAAVAEDTPWHPVQPLAKHFKDSSLQSCYKFIIDFLYMASTEWNSVYEIPESALRELIYSSIRILCAWLDEEANVVQDEAHKVIPFVLSVCNECFLSFQSSDVLCSDSQVSHIDLMQILLPPLDRLIFDDELRAVLLERGLVDIIFQYMLYQWSVHQKNPSGEADFVLRTICKILLTIVCMDAKVVPESEVFFAFLKFLLNIVPLLPPNYENLCLKANFSALGLLITKHYYKRIKSCETSFYRFLSFSVKFLWDSYHVEDRNDAIAFVLVREYRLVWSEIMEPWYLAMQALSMLLSVMPWTTDFLMESGWPQHIIASLVRVGDKAIEGNVKYAYQAFLSALVRVSSDAIQTLNDCEALYVCKKHNLRELEALLCR